MKQLKLFFAADRDIDLWPHFRKHYESLGVTDFFCSSDDTGLINNAHLTVVPCEFASAGHYFDSVQRSFFRLINNNIEPAEWYVIAELDEFQQYDRPIEEWIAKMEPQKYDVLFGDLLDRVAADGSLPPLLPNVPLHQQFPAHSDITRRILRGCRDKVVLCKGKKSIGGGNHGINGGHRAYHERISVFHYKWHHNILKRMAERIRLPDDGNGWVQGNLRVIEHWQEYGSVLV